jgi:hypothetical protein
MTAVRVALSALAAIFVTLFAPDVLLVVTTSVHQAANGQQGAIGIDVISGIPQTFLWPWFWVIALCVFALFFAASRLRSRKLRVILFWAPTLAVSTLGLGIFSLAGYLWLLSRKG